MATDLSSKLTAEKAIHKETRQKLSTTTRSLKAMSEKYQQLLSEYVSMSQHNEELQNEIFEMRGGGVVERRTDLSRLIEMYSKMDLLTTKVVDLSQTNVASEVRKELHVIIGLLQQHTDHYSGEMKRLQDRIPFVEEPSVTRSIALHELNEFETNPRPRNNTSISRVAFAGTPRTPTRSIYRQGSISSAAEHGTLDENESRRHPHRYDREHPVLIDATGFEMEPELPEIHDAALDGTRIIVIRDEENNSVVGLISDDEDLKNHVAESVVSHISDLTTATADTRKRQLRQSMDTDFAFLINAICSHVAQADTLDVLNTMRCIAENLLQSDDKYRVIWRDNPLIQERVLKYDGGYEFLCSLGFELIGKKLVCAHCERAVVTHVVAFISGRIENLEKEIRALAESSGKGTTNFVVDGDESKSSHDPEMHYEVLIQASTDAPPPFIPLSSDDEDENKSSSCDEMEFMYPGKGRTRSNGTISLAEIRDLDRKDSVSSPRGHDRLFTEASQTRHSITAHNPASLLVSDDDSTVLDESEVQTPRGPAPIQTLDSLVIEISNQSKPRLVDALLLCHQEYTSSIELIRTLRRQFRVPVSLEDEDVDQIQIQFSIRAKIVALVRNWLKHYFPEDFDADKELNRELHRFLEDISEFTNDAKKAALLRRNIETSLESQQRQLALSVPQLSRFSESSSYLSTESHSTTQTHSVAISRDRSLERTSGGPVADVVKPCPPSLDGMFDNIEMRYAIIHLVPGQGDDLLTHIDPRILAEQLTVLDFHLFVHIRARECLHQGWKARDKYERAPNILRMIAHFNSVARWVQVSILSAPNVRERVRIVRCMIDIAVHLRQLRNFSSLCAVHGALASFDIQCLKQTWQRVSGNQMRLYQELSEIFSWRGGKIKALQDRTPAPAVPHIGIILSDLHTIEEKSKQVKLQKRGVNRAKICELHKRVSQLQIFQQGEYKDIERNEDIHRMFLYDFKQQIELTPENIQSISDCVRVADSRQHR